jgi:hypothetical protein
MSKEEEFRARAEEADKKVVQASDPEARLAFVEIARNWRIMAEQAKRLGQ